MLLRGDIWQGLRTRALTSIPAGAMLRSGEASTLREWLSAGSYTALRTSRNSLTLHGSQLELGAALVGDSSLYLDAAVEHSCTLRQAFAPTAWSSEGWAIVATYYWAFYVVTALSRLLGDTQIYLDELRARNLVTLSGGQPLAAGTYSLKVGESPDAGRIEVRIKKANATRVHDAIWRAWVAFFQSIVREQGERAERDEADFYKVLLQAFNILGPTWPSDLRNAANYSPSFGYRAVRRLAAAFDVTFLRQERPLSFDDCFSRLRQNVRALNGGDVRGQSRVASRVLIDTTFLLHEVLEALYCEVLERRGIDRRWGNLRRTFLSERATLFGGVEWPLISN